MTSQDIASDFVGIDHIGLNVRDLARSEAWYQDVLGFEVFHRWKTTTIVGLGNIRVGLFWRPDAQPLPDLDKFICMQHLAFLVDGFRFMQTRQRLIDKGIDVADEDNGVGYCVFFADPDGHLLELITFHPAPDPDLSSTFKPVPHSPEELSEMLHDHVPRRPESAKGRESK